MMQNALTTDIFSAADPSAVNHDIEFSLSLDYESAMITVLYVRLSMLILIWRTSSIYFFNRTAIDVAKIESSEHYKHIMHHI